MMAAHGSIVKRAFSAAVQKRAYSAPAERLIPEAKQKYVPTSGTYPKGFLAGSSYAGVKASNTKYDDVSMVVSEELCPAAAVFTKNAFQAAPVQFSRNLVDPGLKTWVPDRGAIKIPSARFRGVVVNSGCANAVTGSLGLMHAKKMARTTDACFESFDEGKAAQTLVMSTGVIGQRLPIDKITDAIPKAHADLGSSHDHWLRAARAICTTDTFPKLISRTFTLPSHPETEYRIAGMTKGAGMIHPNLATLLATVYTDAKIHETAMSTMLRRAARSSFNSISIDGDTSTNDTVAFFANGAAAPEGAKALGMRGGEHTYMHVQDIKAFQDTLNAFMQDLAKLVVRDGEGASKFVTVSIKSCHPAMARRIARSVATSSLVKTALYGQDANWGRILCAIGYAPTSHFIDPEQTSVSFLPSDGSEPLKLLVRGEPEQVDEARAKEILQMEDLEIFIDVGDIHTPGVRTQKTDPKNDRMASPSVSGGWTEEPVTIKFWTCDLSHEYVTINGDYRT